MSGLRNTRSCSTLSGRSLANATAMPEHVGGVNGTRGWDETLPGAADAAGAEERIVAADDSAAEEAGSFGRLR